MNLYINSKSVNHRLHSGPRKCAGPVSRNVFHSPDISYQSVKNVWNYTFIRCKNIAS
jgi:hypothetical protein